MLLAANLQNSPPLAGQGFPDAQWMVTVLRSTTMTRAPIPTELSLPGGVWILALPCRLEGSKSQTELIAVRVVSEISKFELEMLITTQK